jgi:hypothetical protein
MCTLASLLITVVLSRMPIHCQLTSRTYPAVGSSLCDSQLDNRLMFHILATSTLKSLPPAYSSPTSAPSPPDAKALSNSSLKSFSDSLTSPSPKPYASNHNPSNVVLPNPILRLNLTSQSYDIPLDWDLRQRPTSAVYAGTSEGLSMNLLRLAATQPEQAKPTLLLPDFQWPINAKWYFCHRFRRPRVIV